MDNLKLLNFITEKLTSKKNLNKRFFLFKDRYRVWKFTFKEVYDTALKFAILLKKSGIRKDDKVLLKGSNSPEWVISFLSILFCNAIVVPIDIKSTSDFDSDQ